MDKKRPLASGWIEGVRLRWFLKNRANLNATCLSFRHVTSLNCASSWRDYAESFRGVLGRALPR